MKGTVNVVWWTGAKLGCHVSTLQDDGEITRTVLCVVYDVNAAEWD